MVPAGNKTKRLSSIISQSYHENSSLSSNHHHHHHHHHHYHHQRGNSQLLILCWLLLLVVNIDAVILEVNKKNYSLNITKIQFQRQLMVPIHKRTHNRNMEEKYFLLFLTEFIYRIIKLSKFLFSKLIKLRFIKEKTTVNS